MIKHTITFLLILIYLTSFVFAQEYYADISLIITVDGSTQINGITNHPELENEITQNYTSKQEETWTFNLNINEVFSEYVYEIIFLENIEIQKIETLDNYRISTQNGQIIITGFGNNSPLNIKINYIINNETNQQTNNYQTLSIIFIILILIINLIIIIFLKKKKQTNNPLYNKDALTQRQLNIMNLIEKNNGKITQAQLQKQLNYPKSAISRNLITLEKKEIIKKEKKGITMLITLNKK